jgi:hypothetical protein
MYNLLQINCFKAIAFNIKYRVRFQKKGLSCCKIQDIINKVINRMWFEDTILSCQLLMPTKMREEFRLAISMFILSDYLQTFNPSHICPSFLRLENEKKATKNKHLLSLFDYFEQIKLRREINFIKHAWNTIFVNEKCMSILRSNKLQSMIIGHINKSVYNLYLDFHYCILSMACYDLYCLEYSKLTFKYNLMY